MSSSMSPARPNVSRSLTAKRSPANSTTRSVNTLLRGNRCPETVTTGRVCTKRPGIRRRTDMVDNRVYVYRTAGEARE